MKKGWIRIPRSFLENRELCRDKDHLCLLVYILSHMSYQTSELVISVRELSKNTNIPQTSVVRILALFKSWNIIRTETGTGKSHITVDIKELFGTELETETEQFSRKEDEKEKSSKREKGETKELYKKKEPPISPKEGFSSFDTDDFFQAAIERSNRIIKEGAKRYKERAEAN